MVYPGLSRGLRLALLLLSTLLLLEDAHGRARRGALGLAPLQSATVPCPTMCGSGAGQANVCNRDLGVKSSILAGATVNSVQECYSLCLNLGAGIYDAYAAGPYLLCDCGGNCSLTFGKSTYSQSGLTSCPFETQYTCPTPSPPPPADCSCLPDRYRGCPPSCPQSRDGMESTGYPFLCKQTSFKQTVSEKFQCCPAAPGCQWYTNPPPPQPPPPPPPPPRCVCLVNHKKRCPLNGCPGPEDTDAVPGVSYICKKTRKIPLRNARNYQCCRADVCS